MIQVYSSNINVPANTAIPLNNLKVDKGCSQSLASPSTIHLNKRGVYIVAVDGFGSAAAAGDISVQMAVNGLLQPDAISSASVAAADSISPLGFKALVQVQQDNTKCCCSNATELSFFTGDTDITDLHFNVVVTKLC